MISFMDKFMELIHCEVGNKEAMQAAVLTLCANLKAYGHQLETGHKGIQFLGHLYMLAFEFTICM